MNAQRRITGGLPAAALGLALAALLGCGGKGSGGGTGGGHIVVKGTFAPGITLASSVSAPHALAAGAAVIDNVVAADADGRFILATKSGNGFTLSLPAGRLYLIAFLSGTTTKAIYQADPSGSGWIALPVSSASRDVDLGTLTFDATGVGTGTTPPSTVASDLGVDSGVAQVIALWDVAMQRLANVDVDGNGTFDFQEGRSYWFAIHYEFDPNRLFTQIQGGTFSDQTATSYIGYGYDFSAAPVTSSWPVGASTLTSPAAITPNAGGPVTSSASCWSNLASTSQSVNFYCGAGSALGNIAVAPAQPPPGDYSIGYSSAAYTFRNVASQTIDTNLYNVYVPSVKLTMSGSTVTRIDLQWWKNTPAGWVQPSAAELSAIMVWSGFELGRQYWAGPTSDRVSGQLAIAPTTSGSVPPQSSFTPAVLRVSYRDAFGYGYGFEWR
jgi:hypothetical protein